MEWVFAPALPVYSSCWTYKLRSVFCSNFYFSLFLFESPLTLASLSSSTRPTAQMIENLCGDRYYTGTTRQSLIGG